MRRLLVAALVIVSACAPKIVPPPVVTTPTFPDFVRPEVPPALTSTAAGINQGRGWAFLQNGDLKTAEHEFMAALKNDPSFLPAETSLGYLELARKDAKAALPHFDHVLEKQREDLAALVGRVQSLLALDREADAIPALEAVLAVDPTQIEMKRRVDVLKFRASQQEIARARQAARSGRLDEASQAYAEAIARSPESPFLYRELAAVERQQKKDNEALEQFKKAVELDPSDARSIEQIAEIYDARGDLDAALEKYAEAAALEPSAEIDRRMADARARAALAKLPAEYRAIDEAPQITRADLAALIGIRLGRLLQSSSRADAGLVTDVRNSWAQSWIMTVARAGVMEPFANHAFQPRTIVRRADLAQAVARLLSRIPAPRPSAPRPWESARLKFSDLAPGHLAYPAASAAVAAGVMKTTDNAFQPSRPVTGPEAIEAIAKLESLAGLR